MLGASPVFRKYSVDAVTQDWIVDSFSWAARHALLTQGTNLVLPSQDFFPTMHAESSETLVDGLAADLKRMLGISPEAVSVIPFNAALLPQEADCKGLGSTAASWQVEDGQSVIRYEPAMIEFPLVLIAALSHELMNHRLHAMDRKPPGYDYGSELCAEIHCIAAGLGLIQMLGAETVGRQGFLKQTTRAHALALFMRVRHIPLNTVSSLIPRRLDRRLSDAQRQIKSSPPDISAITYQTGPSLH